MSEPPDAELEEFLQYLKDNRAFDFTGYRRGSLGRRIQHRMDRVGVATYDDYVDRLEVDPSEFAQLFDTVLINVSAFFRDPDTWDLLRREVVPALLSARPSGPLRLWSAGCSTGREAYSAVMMLTEVLGADAVRERVKVYATDIDNGALDRARHATYSEREIEGVPPELLEKYFVRSGDTYTFLSDLRRVVIFGRHDLLVDAPISRVDLLMCRNTLMYFNKDVQAEIVKRLHFSVTDHGYLVLGKVEMLLNHGDLFEPIDAKQRVFRKKRAGGLRSRLIAIVEDSGASEAITGDVVAELSFEKRRTPEVLLDHLGNVVAVNEAARGVFAVPSPNVGRPFQDLQLSYRPLELRSEIDRARLEHRPGRVDGVEMRRDGEKVEYFDIDIIPLHLDDNRRFVGVLVSFTDVTAHRTLQLELEHTHRELETAYEELQSANEELETTNEELQSTIEELETMNEELSSTNEELETINDELRDRTNELNQVSAYMESIFSSLDLSVIVLDRNLIVHVWNGRSFDMWGLRPDEAEGRNLATLDIGLPVTELSEPIARCLVSEQPVGPLEVQAVSRRGHPLRCEVTIKPLHRVVGNGGGVVVLTAAVAPVPG